MYTISHVFSAEQRQWVYHLQQNVPEAQQKPSLLDLTPPWSAEESVVAVLQHIGENAAIACVHAQCFHDLCPKSARLILDVDLTQTCFLGGPSLATCTFQGSSGSLSVGGGEV